MFTDNRWNSKHTSVARAIHQNMNISFPFFIVETPNRCVTQHTREGRAL